ncbi:uncharacterized protein LOC135494385 [Lineus longissimus]|uniref:uncharacterized protein LOC135494385 n=1 Tax=Lineus longissimus TaxID=88925 RepID=UPI00315D49D1
MMKTFISSAALVGLFSLSLAAKLTFPSGNNYDIVDESTIGSTANDLVDPKSTGTLLFDATQIDPTLKYMKRLTLNIFIKDFKSPSSNYFRAHPTFLKCLQKVFSDLASQDYKLVLESGFKTVSEASSSVQDLYARAGTGASVAFRQDTPGDILLIAKAALNHCPTIFDPIQRDLGVVLMSDKVNIHMRGTTDEQPYYASDGGSMSTAAFQSWCGDRIDEGLAPNTPDCSSFTGLNSGEVYPTGATSAAETVGTLDIAITRDMTTDFKRLVQFPGTVITFEDSESSSSWCGDASIGCHSCANGIYGSSLNARCADRVMAPRMFFVLNKLQKLVRDNMSGNKLKITEAWDEPHSAATSGDNPSGSLHYDGRQAEAALDGSGSLTDLTKYAICAGVDYVIHNGASVTFAVRAQSTIEETKVAFPDIELLVVTPPTARDSYYQLPSTYTSLEIADMPLFDADNQDDVQLSEATTIKMFRSDDPDFRYFRLNPLIPACFEGIHYQENKGNTTVDINVVRGYITDREQLVLFDPLFDKRYNTHILGQAMQIAYNMTANNDSISTYTVHRLANYAVDNCAQSFYEAGQQMGIGIYEGSIYIDLRDDFEVWVEKTSLLPNGITIDEYEDSLAERFVLAVENRLINPDDYDLTCSSTVPPKIQNPTYEFQFSAAEEELRRRRRRRKRSTSEECIPQTNTEFCTATKPHRDAEVALLWKEITRKHLYRNPVEVKAALDGCFGACGTCIEGDIWEEKTKNCDNLFHWVPFGTLNQQADQTNFFARDNLDTKAYSCDRGEHCMEKSPLFSLFAPSIERLYRPDPAKSVKEELYGAADNPTPAMDLIHRVYALTAAGNVKVWAKDETEITSMKNALKVLMIYAPNVTNVMFYVTQDISLDSANSVIENFVNDWTTTTCPDWSRQYVAPFEATDQLPAGITKRDAKYDLRNEMVRKARNWEMDWIEHHFHY